MQNPNSWTTKLTLLLASSLTVMAGATVSPSLPAMKQQFESSPIAGIIVDRFGRKPLLLITAILYGFAGSSGLFLDNLPAILVGRALLGFAVAGVMVSATTLIADYYGGPARAAFMGLQAGFMGLGGVVFLTLGGALAQQNWHSQSGMAIALSTLFLAISSVTYGKLKQRLEFVTFLPIIFGLMGIGYLLIGQSSNWAQVLVGLAVSGIGLGIIMPNMSVWLSSAVPDNLRGRALGGLSTAMFLGQFLSPIVTQPLTKTMGLSGTYALTGGILVIIALGFAVFKSQVRSLTRSRAV
jgi:MFS family permease